MSHIEYVRCPFCKQELSYDKDSVKSSMKHDFTNAVDSLIKLESDIDALFDKFVEKIKEIGSKINSRFRLIRTLMRNIRF